MTNNNQPTAAQSQKPVRDQNIKLRMQKILAENAALKKRLAAYQDQLSDSNSTAFQESQVIANLESQLNKLNNYIQRFTQPKGAKNNASRH